MHYYHHHQSIRYYKNKIKHLLLLKNGEEVIITNKKLTEGNFRGTGCRLSTAISCYLAKGYDLIEAVKKANRFVYYDIKNQQVLKN